MKTTLTKAAGILVATACRHNPNAYHFHLLYLRDTRKRGPSDAKTYALKVIKRCCQAATQAVKHRKFLAMESRIIINSI